jgi:protoporphyrinogen oxidase
VYFLSLVGLVSTFCVAADENKIFNIENGNNKLIENCIEKSSADVKYSTKVTEINKKKNEKIEVSK